MTGVDVVLDVMSAEQRQQLQSTLRAESGVVEREIPFAKPSSLTRVYAVASGKGGVGKSSVTVNLAAAMAKRGLCGRARGRGHLRPLDPADARRRPAARPRSRR